MIIGKLRHLVKLQSSADTQNEFGEETNKVWSTDENIFASIEPIRGRELLEFQQMNAEVTHRIIIRNTSNATAAKRILWGSRIFDINVVRKIEERNIMMELLCKEMIDLT
jgi:SPP1 family predicted phage head-tail adaptor